MKTLRSFSYSLAALGAVWLLICEAPRFAESRTSAGQLLAEDPPQKSELLTVPSSQPEQLSPALQTLREARAKLATYRSIQADLVETVALASRRFKATGTYVQGSNLKLRLDFHVSLGEGDYFDGRLLQVCDGQVLWTVTRIGPKTPARKPDAIARKDSPADAKSQAANLNETVTRRDVRQILNVASGLDVSQKLLEAEIGLGGLPALLAALERGMTFDALSESTLDGQPYIVLEGRWSERQLEAWGSGRKSTTEKPGAAESVVNPDEKTLPEASPDSEDKPESTEPPVQKPAGSAGETSPPKSPKKTTPLLPSHVPDLVRVYLDRENLFPRRILYLKRLPGYVELDKVRPMLALDFVKVVLNGAVDDALFEYSPPDGVVPNDVTQFYIRQLQLTKNQ